VLAIIEKHVTECESREDSVVSTALQTGRRISWSVSAELTGLVLQAQLSSSGSSSRHHTSMGFGLVSISTSFAGLDINLIIFVATGRRLCCGL